MMILFSFTMMVFCGQPRPHMPEMAEQIAMRVLVYVETTDSLSGTQPYSFGLPRPESTASLSPGRTGRAVGCMRRAGNLLGSCCRCVGGSLRINHCLACACVGTALVAAVFGIHALSSCNYRSVHARLVPPHMFSPRLDIWVSSKNSTMCPTICDPDGRVEMCRDYQGCVEVRKNKYCDLPHKECFDVSMCHAEGIRCILDIEPQ